jgi:aryl-alcohol dehydrogenase-like predicted oxidoreductase
MKLILGTSNFGSFYGLGEKRKIYGFSKQELKKISIIAKKKKINFIDTSFNYKNAHSKISKLSISNKKIITKISVKAIVNKKNFKNLVKKKIYLLIEKFNFKIYALLIHDFYLLSETDSVKSIKILNELKKEKLFLNTGISIYNPNEILKIYNKVPFDIIQTPINVLDNRFEKFKYLNQLKKRKIKIIGRSCFLQGILSMNKPIPSSLLNFESKILSWKHWCDVRNLDYVTACIHFLKNKKYLNFIIFGFDSPNQLIDLVNKYYTKVLKVDFYANIRKKDDNLIDPRYWN